VGNLGGSVLLGDGGSSSSGDIIFLLFQRTVLLIVPHHKPKTQGHAVCVAAESKFVLAAMGGVEDAAIEVEDLPPDIVAWVILAFEESLFGSIW
jgi:hypothetical protein